MEKKDVVDYPRRLSWLGVCLHLKATLWASITDRAKLSNAERSSLGGRLEEHKDSPMMKVLDHPVMVSTV
jgi:hypothetical protein